MTYKTRQEVLRAAADWIDVCEMHGVDAELKWKGAIKKIRVCSMQEPPYEYEFPLALLEGKEVWVGSELWNVPNNFKFIANSTDFLCERIRILDGKGRCGWIEDCSWNPPKPTTVMVEMLVEDAESVCKFDKLIHMTLCGTPTERLAEACKKALEKL